MTRNKTTWLASFTGVTAAFLLAASAGWGGRPQTAGEITGKILFEGPRPKLAIIQMDKDPVCVAKHKEPVHVEDGEVNPNGTLRNAFVYVKSGAAVSYPVPKEAVVLTQNGCMYEPHVLGIMAGQELEVVSKDPTTHNIHPMPKDNPEWNQSQPPGAAPLVRRFAHPEIMIPVKCNQHPWMRAYIGVTRNPFYTVTGSDGTFSIKGLPPGDYTIEVWTATFGSQDREVSVPPNRSASADFTFKAE